MTWGELVLGPSLYYPGAQSEGLSLPKVSVLGGPGQWITGLGTPVTCSDQKGCFPSPSLPRDEEHDSPLAQRLLQRSMELDLWLIQHYAYRVTAPISMSPLVGKMSGGLDTSR